ncbi:MAG: hypothetical protein AB1485_05725 [Candidatus Thermoplasmatota archaeon]
MRILHLTPESELLGDKYVEQKIIPARYRDDALHIAIGVLNELDVIVSWNLRHMVKLKTVNGVNSISRKLGYKQIDIRTPGEVVP